MLKQLGVALCLGTLVAGTSAAQSQKKSGTKGVMHDITVTADTVYTGTMQMAIDGVKVTGDMRITAPTEITGKVAGTSKAGVLTLEFPFLMVQQKCEGTVKMNLTIGDKPGYASGTMDAVGCDGGQESGTVELKPAATKPAK